MKPSSRWVYEDTGSKGRFTNSAAERSALGCSEDPFSFKTGLGEIRAGELILWGSESFPNEAERLAAASMSFKTKTRASCSSLVIVGGSVKLDAERLAAASMSFKTKTRASSSSLVIVGGSVKLDAERLAAASMSFKTKTRASCSSLVIVGGSVKLDAVLGGCMKTLALKGASRTPRLKEVLSDVLRIRSRLRRDSGKSGLEN
ncbi:hypothetical protein MRB53_010150 [Persea americana]|uniref:Uncharacterized protein n=1 Tax=Persea americana TaxID=3435 RepID=A0ACC2LRS7_PERAE|nr:hypothetical protein MRB53_010150 [Persea americana]